MWSSPPLHRWQCYPFSLISMTPTCMSSQLCMIIEYTWIIQFGADTAQICLKKKKDAIHHNSNCRPITQF